jgi:hypothetical protein
MPDHPFEFFDGGVSPIEAFKTDCDALLALQEASAFRGDDASFLIVATPPIAFVSLMAFSEGFFKSTFGAVGNMSPRALAQFVEKRRDLSVPLDDLLLLKDRLDHRIGSLTAERLDFGSAKKINANFFDLLSITPFSTTDVRTYESALSVRNQLVHHGGIITAKYFRQQQSPETTSADIYWGSVDITQRTVIDAVAFLRTIAVKLTKECVDRLTELEGEKILQSSSDRYPIFKYLRGDFSIFDPRRKSKSVDV